MNQSENKSEQEEQLYYVWADCSCDNCTPDLEQAKKWADEFASEGAYNVHILDIDGNVVSY